jgi:hypothetical protein
MNRRVRPILPQWLIGVVGAFALTVALAAVLAHYRLF